MTESIFSKIIKGEIPADKIYEDKDTIAIMDIQPSNLGHSLVIPKEEYRNIIETPDEVVEKLIVIAKKVAKASIEALGADGVNIIINTEPVAGQVVFHTHIHIIPRFEGDGLKPWPKREDITENNIKEAGEKIRQILVK